MLQISGNGSYSSKTFARKQTAIFLEKVFGCYVNITIQSFYNPLNDAYTIISSIEKILEDLEERLAQIITNVCMDHVALRLGRQDR